MNGPLDCNLSCKTRSSLIYPHIVANESEWVHGSSQFNTRIGIHCVKTKAFCKIWIGTTWGLIMSHDTLIFRWTIPLECNNFRKVHRKGYRCNKTDWFRFFFFTFLSWSFACEEVLSSKNVLLLLLKGSAHRKSRLSLPLPCVKVIFQSDL